MDVVHYVHTLMAKNARQAYAVSLKAGHQVNPRTDVILRILHEPDRPQEDHF